MDEVGRMAHGRSIAQVGYGLDKGGERGAREARSFLLLPEIPAFAGTAAVGPSFDFAQDEPLRESACGGIVGVRVRRAIGERGGACWGRWLSLRSTRPTLAYSKNFFDAPYANTMIETIKKGAINIFVSSFQSARAPNVITTPTTP